MFCGNFSKFPCELSSYPKSINNLRSECDGWCLPTEGCQAFFSPTLHCSHFPFHKPFARPRGLPSGVSVVEPGGAGLPSCGRAMRACAAWLEGAHAGPPGARPGLAPTRVFLFSFSAVSCCRVRTLSSLESRRSKVRRTLTCQAGRQLLSMRTLHDGISTHAPHHGFSASLSCA